MFAVHTVHHYLGGWLHVDGRACFFLFKVPFSCPDPTPQPPLPHSSWLSILFSSPHATACSVCVIGVTRSLYLARLDFSYFLFPSSSPLPLFPCSHIFLERHLSSGHLQSILYNFLCLHFASLKSQIPCGI